MKKLFAVVMVIAILFNSGGYDLFFQYLMYRSDSKIFDKINHSHYRVSELAEVKVPVDFPAQAPQEYTGEYIPIGGQIQIKNNKYDYAEIKITRDTLYLRVLPNPELARLGKANVLYGKLVNDLPASNSKHSSNSLVKKSLSESIVLPFVYNYSLGIKLKKLSHRFLSSNILEPSLDVGMQPPEA
ncbi:MAG: hypothetical protein JST19_09000 [Bacteroidetes bacterium]|nr:hypothetical protein [Bacteroidota bacterium]